MTEIKSAFRALARRPSFSLWVIAIFAAGIAANTAVFSIFDGLFLRALPFRQPDRVVYLLESIPGRHAGGRPFSHADLEGWRKGSQVFEDIAGFKDYLDGAYLSGLGDTIRVNVVNVTHNLASTLGFNPVEALRLER